jgi:hypothetical protein
MSVQIGDKARSPVGGHTLLTEAELHLRDLLQLQPQCQTSSTKRERERE